MAENDSVPAADSSDSDDAVVKRTKARAPVELEQAGDELLSAPIVKDEPGDGDAAVFVKSAKKDKKDKKEKKKDKKDKKDKKEKKKEKKERLGDASASARADKKEKKKMKKRRGSSIASMGLQDTKFEVLSTGAESFLAPQRPASPVASLKHARSPSPTVEKQPRKRARKAVDGDVSTARGAVAEFNLERPGMNHLRRMKADLEMCESNGDLRRQLELLRECSALLPLRRDVLLSGIGTVVARLVSGPLQPLAVTIMSQWFHASALNQKVNQFADADEDAAMDEDLPEVDLGTEIEQAVKKDVSDFPDEPGELKGLAPLVSEDSFGLSPTDLATPVAATGVGFAEVLTQSDDYGTQANLTDTQFESHASPHRAENAPRIAMRSRLVQALLTGRGRGDEQTAVDYAERLLESIEVEHPERAAQMLKIKGLLGHLSNPKNSQLRERILSGVVDAYVLCRMPLGELEPPDAKRQRDETVQEAIREMRGVVASQAAETVGAEYLCPSCTSPDCTFTQMDAPDGGVVVWINCLACGHRWQRT